MNGRDDSFFVATLFQGALCLFLSKWDMTASRKLKDLRSAGGPSSSSGFLWLLRPFATSRDLVAHDYWI